MKRVTQFAKLAVVLMLPLAGCAEAEASPKKDPTPDELATLAHEGPKPQTSSQRFVRARNVEAPPSETKSKAPTPAEWAKAADATDVRITDPDCTAKRVREWYRITCSGFVSFLGGKRDEMHFGGSEEKYEAWVIFPARIGDSRAAQFLTRFKWQLSSNTILSEQWLEGDPAPLISVTGVTW